MGKRDDEYQLSEDIELDDGFFKTVKEQEENQELKRGRGSQKQTAVFQFIGMDSYHPTFFVNIKSDVNIFTGEV